MMSNKTRIHETQKTPPDYAQDEQTVVNEDLLPLQNIEGGGPPRKVYLNTLPRPIRFFGYFLMCAAFVMLILAAIVTVFR